MNKNEELLPYYEKARELLNYNPSTGELTWAVDRSNNAKKGSIAGSLYKNGYIKISITLKGETKRLLAHRLAWFFVNDVLPNGMIDHIDCNKVNNIIENLREVNSSQNSMNWYRHDKGVNWAKRESRWRARIRLNYKDIHLGYFKTKKEAINARKKAEEELFGEFSFYYNDSAINL